jgi:uncharacterized protein YfaS (alpha-2-macroglobulin family)
LSDSCGLSPLPWQRSRTPGHPRRASCNASAITDRIGESESYQGDAGDFAWWQPVDP